MKKTIITIIIAICTLTILTINTNHTYVKKVKVIDKNQEIISVIDENNNYWSFYGDEYKINDNLLIEFTDNNTETIYDDMIIRVIE